MTPQLATQVLTDEPQAAPTLSRSADWCEPERRTDESVVAVVGLGYVGLPTAIALRGAGARIIGIDVSRERLEQIERGGAELIEQEQVELGRFLGEEGGFSLTDSAEALEAADLVMVCVPTPVDERRCPDPRALRRACASVVAHARQGQTIVLTSTKYVGSTRELLVEPLAARGLRAGEDVFVAFAPERIDPGVAEHTQRETPRVIGAVSESCFRRAAELLRHTCERLHRVSSPEAAEMVKLYENSFRAVNIALAFEMAEACRAHGLDAREVTEGGCIQALRVPRPPFLGGRGRPLHRRRPALPACAVARAWAPRDGRRGGDAKARGAPAARRLARTRDARAGRRLARRGARARGGDRTSLASRTAARRRRSRSSGVCGRRERRSTSTTRWC